MYINETYDSWSMGMVILELMRNQHYIVTERINNHPRCAKSDSNHNDILHRIAHETFLDDIDEFIESHYKNKSFSYPILTSLLCESVKRKSAKEILQMSCFKFDGTSKTKKFQDEIEKIDQHIIQGFHTLKIDLEKMKTSILEEFNETNLTQYMDLKLILEQIHSSIPKNKVELETYISMELGRVMSCIKTTSCKTELVQLEESLLKQLHSQQYSLEDITTELKDGITSIQEGLNEVYTKFNTFSQTMIEFQLEVVKQLTLFTKDQMECEEDDIDMVLGELETIQNQIETLQSRNILRNKDVKRFIQKFIPTMKTNCQDILQLSNLQFNQLQTQLEKQCKDSEENQEELCFLLSTILSFVKKTNEKINTCIKN